MSTFLIRSATSQSSSYPIVLTKLGGPRSRPNPHSKFMEVPGIEPAQYSEKMMDSFRKTIMRTVDAILVSSSKM